MSADHDRASGMLALTPDARPPGSAADILSDVLETVRLTGALFFLVDAWTPWVAEAPAGQALAPVLLPRAQHVVSYHVVHEGACWCESPGQPPVRLEAGEAIVVPHGHEYALTSQPGLRTGYTPDETLTWFRDMADGRLPFVVREGGNGPERIRVTCGFLGCDALPFNPVLAMLPPLWRVRVRAGDDDRLSRLLGFALEESRDRRLGSGAVLLRIAELVFVELVRAHLTSLAPDAGGWLGGLRHHTVGQALARLHGQPSRAWTLGSLARDIGVSRSVLAERFVHFIGQPPMVYLTRWRMQIASVRLLDPTSKVATVAHDVGYESEAAFSRAFKRAAGVSPAMWRRHPATSGAHQGTI